MEGRSGRFVTADALVAGPRGRRLLLEFAVASEADVLGGSGELPLREAVRDAAFRLAKDHGHAVTRFRWGELRARPELTVVDVVSRLGDVPLAWVSPALLVASLTDSVDSAMYWQGPDGDDLLCAIPEVRDALMRVADHLVGSPEVQGWAARYDPADQWQVLWDGDDPALRPDLAEWSAQVVQREQAARRDRPADPRANWTDHWWSRPPLGLATSTGSFGDAGPYGLWLVEDGFGWETATVQRLEVDSAAKVLEIDGAQAWAALCAQFPLEVTASKRHDWYRTTGLSGRWVIPDWSRVAEHYDGIHLTIAGYLEAATTGVDVGEAASVIAGWGPDATWWLTNAARPVGNAVRWHTTSDGSPTPWTPTL